MLVVSIINWFSSINMEKSNQGCKSLVFSLINCKICNLYKWLNDVEASNVNAINGFIPKLYDKFSRNNKRI